MGLFIKADGETQEVYPQKGKHFSLEELQGFVGGYIEIIRIGDRFMVVNEEGKLNGLETNGKATMLFVKHYGQTDMVVGNVLIAESTEIN